MQALSHLTSSVALRSHANYKEYLITKNVHNYVTRPPFNYPLLRPKTPTSGPTPAASPNPTRLPTILYGHINKAMAILLSLSIEHSCCPTLTLALSLSLSLTVQ